MSSDQQEKTTGIAPGLNKALVHKAATALLSHLNKDKDADNLFYDDHVTLYLSVHLKRTPGRQIPKPVRIPIPHTLLNPEDGIELCLITKDSDEVRDYLLKNPVAGITKVMTVDTLRRKYREYKRRRDLVSRFAGFFCDDRVTPMMYKLCGKVFISKKKLPISVRVDRGNIKKNLERARDSTYLHIGQQLTSIKIARSSMTPDQVTENIMTAIEPAVATLPKKWKGIQSIHLAATDSVALPLWKCVPEISVEDSTPQVEIKPEDAAVMRLMIRQLLGEHLAKVGVDDDSDDDDDDSAVEELEDSPTEESVEEEPVATKATGRKRKLEEPKSKGKGDGKASSSKSNAAVKKAKSAKVK